MKLGFAVKCKNSVESVASMLSALVLPDGTEKGFENMNLSGCVVEETFESVKSGRAVRAQR